MTIQLASDNFNRANSSTLGANWTNNTLDSGGGGTESPAISSDTCVPGNVSNDESSWYSAISWPNDQYSEITHGIVLTNQVVAGMCCHVRLSSGNYYRLSGSSQGFECLKNVAGAYTTLSGGLTSTTFATGDVMRITVQGTAITCSKNGTTFYTTTDASIATGSAGCGWSSTGTPTPSITLWAGGNLLTASIPVAWFTC